MVLPQIHTEIPSKEIITLYVEGGITGDYEIKYIDCSKINNWLDKEVEDFLINTGWKKI